MIFLMLSLAMAVTWFILEIINLIDLGNRVSISRQRKILPWMLFLIGLILTAFVIYN